jgi:hypothetical protein
VQSYTTAKYIQCLKYWNPWTSGSVIISNSICHVKLCGEFMSFLQKKLKHLDRITLHRGGNDCSSHLLSGNCNEISDRGEILVLGYRNLINHNSLNNMLNYTKQTP